MGTTETQPTTAQSYSKIHTEDKEVVDVDLEAGAAASSKSNVEPDDDDDDSKEISAGRLLTLAKPEWPTMGIGLIFLTLTQVSSMAIPWFFGQLIDVIGNQTNTEAENREEMRRIVLTLLIIMVVTSFFLFFRGFIFNASGERVVARLRIRLFRSILQVRRGEERSGATS